MKLRRLGIIGDIHAEHEALGVALDFLNREGVDAVLAVGDVVDGLGSATECCNLLAQSGAQAVRGNHDRWFLAGTMRDLPEATAEYEVDEAARSFLECLPPTRRITTARGDLLLCHGTGNDDMNAVRPEDSGYALDTNDALQGLLGHPDVALLVCGHSHRRMVRRIGTLTIINAGTLYRRDDPGFGIVDLGGEPQVTFFERIVGDEVVTVDVVPLTLDR